MRTYIFAPLLFILSAAAPVADDQFTSSVLQKRDIHCDLRLGHGILKKDCDDAVAEMRRITPIAGVFNRYNPDRQYRLPQRFSVGTCTILVDTIDHTLLRLLTWDIVAVTANNVINQCVYGYGTGGRFELTNFDIIIVNEANMGEEMRQPWLHCINTINAQESFNSFVHCFQVLMAEYSNANQAGSPASQRQARAIEDISVLRDRD